MAYGLLHKTTRRWLTKAGGESLRETMAREFPDREKADAFRTGLESFADAWSVEEIGAIRDGQGTVTQRTAAWAAVERAQAQLNTDALELLPDQVGTLLTARSTWERTVRTSPESADAWRVVEAAQRELNRAARQVQRLGLNVAALGLALEEYHRLGGSATRAPGVGGLT